MMLARFSRSLLSNKSNKSKTLLYQTISHFSNDTSGATDNGLDQQVVEQFTKMHTRKSDKVTTRKPAVPYDTPLTIETPSILLNIDKFNDNINNMNTRLDEINSNNDENESLRSRLYLRANSNIHKCSDIIQHQLKMHNNSNNYRMNGICCSTINEAELLTSSSTNFLSSNTNNKISDILLTNISIDLHCMWRYIKLYNITVTNIKLSTCIDDIFQIHLWNYTINENKKIHQNLLTKHTSSAADGSVNVDNGFKLGIMIILKGNNNDIGVNINDKDSKESIMNILNIIHNEYNNNLYFRGFYIQDTDPDSLDVIKRWIFTEYNDLDLNKLYISSHNEIYDDEYIFDNGSLTLLTTITNIYEDSDNNRFIHILDCGYNSYTKVPLNISSYHRPKYILDNDKSLSPIMNNFNDISYEIINNNNNNQHNTILISNTEFDVGGKMELIPNEFNSTINLYNYFVTLENDRQIVSGIWTIDARGPGN